MSYLIQTVMILAAFEVSPLLVSSVLFVATTVIVMWAEAKHQFNMDSMEESISL